MKGGGGDRVLDHYEIVFVLPVTSDRSHSIKKLLACSEAFHGALSIASACRDRCGLFWLGLMIAVKCAA